MIGWGMGSRCGLALGLFFLLLGFRGIYFSMCVLGVGVCFLVINSIGLRWLG